MIILFKIIFSIFAIIGIVNPELSWKISEGWKFRNVEPSEAYLVLTRIVGVITLIVIWLLFPNSIY